MKKNRQDVVVKRKLRIAFILGVAAILGAALLISSAAEIVFVKTGIIPKEWRDNETVLFTIIWACVSIILGSIISIFVSIIYLKPMNDLLSSISKLSRGDYSVRLVCKKGSVINSAYKEINHLASELEHTEILRSDFVNNFSHEFKTPINSINGLIKLMKKGNLSKEKQLEYLSIIEEESQRLSIITTNILNLSKFENQGVISNKVKYNVSEQLRMCVLLFEKKWNAKHLNLSLDFDEFYLTGNEEMLNHVWTNLIDNAIKFSNDGGELNIRISGDEKDLCVEIINTGSEIKEEDKERIFHKFYQADTTHNKEGNGIGLSIVKRIVELHDGKVDVLSYDGKTCFKVYLPWE